MKSLSALLSTADSLRASKRLPCTKTKYSRAKSTIPHTCSEKKWLSWRTRSYCGSTCSILFSLACVHDNRQKSEKRISWTLTLTSSLANTWWENKRSSLLSFYLCLHLFLLFLSEMYNEQIQVTVSLSILESAERQRVQTLQVQSVLG